LPRSNVCSTRDLENPSASVHLKRFSTPSLTLKFLCAGKLNPRPPKMDGIEQFVRWGAARLGGACHAGGDARPDRALGCVDCDARFARARYRYQSHTMRALRAVAYLTNALQVRSLVAGEGLPVGVADDEAGLLLLDGRGRREAARRACGGLSSRMHHRPRQRRRGAFHGQRSSSGSLAMLAAMRRASSRAARQ